MARYIDADKAVEEARLSYCKECNCYNGVRCSSCGFEDAMSYIEDAPTADVVEVKHGEWIIDTSIKARGFYEVNYKVLITCSICGNRHCLGEQPYPTFKQEELKTDTYRKYRYCGECGAKMDGGKAE